MANFILNFFHDSGVCCSGACDSINVTGCACSGCAIPTLCNCGGSPTEIPYAVTAKENGAGDGVVYVFYGDSENCYYYQCGCASSPEGCDPKQLALLPPNKTSWEISLDGGVYYYKVVGTCLNPPLTPLGDYYEDPPGSQYVEVSLHTQCKEDFPVSCAECPESC